MSFLATAETPTALFLAALAERPSAEFRRDYTWHIGNLHQIGDLTGYFAVGRNSPTSIPKWDPIAGDFFDAPEVTGPYTPVVFDAHIGLIAIERQTDLAPTTEEIALKVERLLQRTASILRDNVDVKIDPIADPAGFVSRIESAYAVKVFTASFTGPNPIDADDLFQRPLSVYLNATNGSRGTATVRGSHLNTETVAAVARSTAATGNTASASVQDERGGPRVRVKLSGDPLRLNYTEQPQPKTVLGDAQSKYREVRHERG